MISLKEYAQKKNISYEAVRKQVNRYRNELGDHLYKKDRTQYLDEDGEAFLDQKRASNPVILVEHDKDEQIEDLTRQNESLRVKIMELQDQLIKSKDQLLERDQQLIELKDQLYLLTEKQEAAPPESKPEEVETEEKVEQPKTEDDDDGSAPTEKLITDDDYDGTEPTVELTPDMMKQPRVQPLYEPKTKKKWWQFWK
jgi:hypothetical protein